MIEARINASRRMIAEEAEGEARKQSRQGERKMKRDREVRGARWDT